MENLKNIIRNSNMSARPEFYSGRGAILCDLNSDILQKIYLGIEKEFGKDLEFCNSVKQIKELYGYH